jgi:hypothetical protein
MVWFGLVTKTIRIPVLPHLNAPPAKKFIANVDGLVLARLKLLYIVNARGITKVQRE